MSTYDRQDPLGEVFGSHLNFSGITPVGNKILIKLAVPADLVRAKTSGLHIPESVEERYVNAGVAAQVIQIGSGAYAEKYFPEGPWCKAGDWVVMSPYTGTRIHATMEEGSDYRLIQDDTIQGLVPNPDFVTRGSF